MCGIFALCTPDKEPHKERAAPLTCTWERALPHLRRRGPDSQGIIQVSVPGFVCTLGSSLLHLRGTERPVTPLQDAQGNILLFNGEVYQGLEISSGESDSAALFASLTQEGASVVATLSTLEGPWALCFWEHSTQTLWAARDALGRRSLLLCQEDSNNPLAGFAIASVAQECRSATQCQTDALSARAGAQSSQESDSSSPSSSADSEFPARTANHKKQFASKFLSQTSELEESRKGHNQAVEERVLEQQPLADASASGAWQEIQPGIHSICLEKSGLSGTEMASWQLHRWENARLSKLLNYTRPPKLICCPEMPQEAKVEAATVTVLAALRAAVRLQCTCIDVPPKPTTVAAEMSRSGVDVAPAPVLVLFSGGVDSTLIAALAHQALPSGVPIDLATICFDDGKSPDRASALDAVQELAQFAPFRQWRLIEVDASLADIERHRSHLLGLLHPANTVMDLNIGAALWLAAQAVGRMRIISGSTAILGQDADYWQAGRRYRSTAKIILVGHGADEQCAGYGRHRTKFKHSEVVLHISVVRERCAARSKPLYTLEFEGLQAELQLDVRRLWLRNLGRDDRLIADHGRESRHPFLDEGFMAAVLDLPLPIIADLQQPAGQGDKQLLRNALKMLGLPRAAGRVKRAIQFGTKLGKLANIQTFGSNRGGGARHAGTLKVQDLGPS